MATKAVFSYSFLGAILFLLSIYLGPFFTPAASSVGLAARDIVKLSTAESGTHANLTKRLSSSDYSHAVDKGQQLHCLLGMTEAQATARNGGTSLESDLQEDYMELEGWSEIDDSNAPYFGNYLDTAFSGLGVTKNVRMENWVNNQAGTIFQDLENLEDDQPGVPTGALFMNDFIVGAGVIIADKNKNVDAAMSEQYGGSWRSLGLPVTHVQRWSDAAFMEWLHACSWEGGSVSNVKYIFRAWITNALTQEIVFQALINAFGSSPTIGKWDSRLTLTAQDNTNEFNAVLGSPNGAGTAYLLLTHKGQLGVKTINKVDIFVPNIPFTVTGATGGGAASQAKIMLLFYVEDAET